MGGFFLFMLGNNRHPEERAMENKNVPHAAAGKVEGDSLFKHHFNVDPEFQIKIDRMIENAARKWTHSFELTDMADDIAQQLRLNFLTGTGGLTLLMLSDTDQKKYIGTSARNQCLKKLNELAAMQDALAGMGFDTGLSSPSPQEAARKEREEEQFRKAEQYLQRLTELERDIYLLKIEQDLTYREIAEQVDMSASGVRKIYLNTVTKIEGYTTNER